MPYYDPYSGQEVETEEERLKREQELANTAVHTTETKTYGDGTVEQVTKQEIPPQAQVTAPVAPVAPLVQAQPAQAKPQFDQTAYNASIAQQESGARPDIGYHDRSKSSAFGMFGITAPAYQDARRVDPSLPEDITKATQEQQTQAQNIITNNNARFLQSKGIEPTPGVLAAAHFAGPSGLHKFLTQTDEQGRPYISPQAQAANGGYDKARAIIEGRLQGQGVASSGAAQRPTAMPGEGVAVATGQGVQGTMGMAPGPVSPEQVNQQAQQFAQSLQQFAQAPVSKTTEFQNQFQNIQDNVKGLNDFIDNPDTPEYLKKRAADRRYELINNQYQEQKAKERLADLNPNEAARLLSTTPKDQEGSWLKFLLLGFISPQLAGAEAIKLGLAPTRWETATITDENGKETAVEVQRRADGKILSGNIAGTDKKLTAEQLGQASEGIMGKGVHVTKVENRINPKTGEVVSVQTLSNGKEKFMLGGKKYEGDKETLVPEAQHTKQENTRVNAGYSNLAKLTANPTQQQKFEALRNAGVSSGRIEQELGLAPGSLAGKTTMTVGTTAPAGNAQSYVPPKTAAAAQNPAERPVQQLGEPDKDYAVRLKSWENKDKLQQKDAEAFVTKATDVRSTLNKFREGIDIIDKNEHNLGPNFSLSGAGPLPKIQQFFGSQFGTDASANTDILRSLITRGGLEGIKNYMGPAISNFDVETWMKNNPIKESSPPAAIRAWLQKTHDAMLDAAEMQRKNAVNKGMLEPSFTLGNKIGEPGSSDVRKRADSIIGR